MFVNFINSKYIFDLNYRFKPLQMSSLVAPCREEFERLFHETFSVKDNAEYLSNIQVSILYVSICILSLIQCFF